MVIVLCYHKISDIRNDYNGINVMPDNFWQQMKYLNNQYKVIPLENLYMEINQGKQCFFAVTFDDGYSDVFSAALPILEEFNIPATAFVTTGNLGTKYENWTDNIVRAIFEPARQRDFFECSDGKLMGRWYTRNIEEKVSFYRKMNYLFRHIGAESRRRYEDMLLEWAGIAQEGRKDRRILSMQELKKLSKSPLVTIGSHCVTHPSLGALTDEEQELEISDSIKILEKITGLPVKYMAYPFGSRSTYNTITIELLKKYGIQMAFTTTSEKITRETDPYQIPRVVMGNYGLDEFKDKIANIILKYSAEDQLILRDKETVKKPIYYLGSIEKDMLLLEGKENIIVWGCGFWGRSLYNDLKLLNLQDRVVAFGDNDPKKTGLEIEGIPVLNKQDISNLFMDKNPVILIKNSHELEIYDDLKKSGFKELHLIAR